MDLTGQGAVLALDGDGVAVELYLNAFRYCDRCSTNSRHSQYLPLPYKCKDFTADIQLASLLVGHNALRCGNDGNTQATQYLRQLLSTCVYTQTRLGNALQAGDCLLIVVVLQCDVDRPRLP